LGLAAWLLLAPWLTESAHCVVHCLVRLLGPLAGRLWALVALLPVLVLLVRPLALQAQA
jgi:hypothetical protein